MIIILDTQRGEVYHFKTRISAGEFLCVSQPTLRGWLKHPFYFYRTLIIILTSDDRAKHTARLVNLKSTTYKHKPNGTFANSSTRPDSGGGDIHPRLEVLS